MGTFVRLLGASENVFISLRHLLAVRGAVNWRRIVNYVQKDSRMLIIAHRGYRVPYVNIGARGRTLSKGNAASGLLTSINKSKRLSPVCTGRGKHSMPVLHNMIFWEK